MADNGQRTEQPTQRRLERARREGNFPSSKELVSALQLLGFAALIVNFGGSWFRQTIHYTRVLLGRAVTIQITPAALTSLAWDLATRLFVPLVLSGVCLVFLVTLAQLVTTGFGFSGAKLAPDFKRLNPLTRIQSLPGQNVPVLIQALALLPLMGLAVYYEVFDNLDQFRALPWMHPARGFVSVAGIVEKLLWRVTGLFLVVGIVDLFWQRPRYTRQLRMTKQEIRDEAKEQQGNPQIKVRIRRLQRDLLRRQMMKEVPKATAVIVNPTHFAVAIRYSLEDGSAPRVVAKGKNYLALRIRQRAIEHQVPIVENPPLAQALYKSVNVGQEIPANLYRAVAEILAYIYRLMNGHLPGG